MKTLYITRGNNIVVDNETNTANRLNEDRSAINAIYLVKEPMHVVYGFGENHTEQDVEEGDIIVVFYDNTFKNQLVVVKNNERWVENIKEYNKEMQAEKERWAKSHAGECEDCDN